MNFNFISLIDVLGFVQGTLLGVILMLSYQRNKAIPLLGVFLFAYSFELIHSIADDTGFLDLYPAFLYLPIRFYWLFMPALYLYTKSITNKMNWKKDAIHFIPSALEFVVFSLLCLCPVDMKVAWTEAGFIEVVYISLTIVLVFFYIIKTMQWISAHQKKMEDYYSSIQGKTLRWIKWICIYVLFTLIVVSNSIFTSPEINDIIYPIYGTINVIFIFWVALSGFRQVYLQIPETQGISENIAVSIEKENGISDDNSAAQKEYEQLINFMKKEQIYKDPQLNLAKLASQMKYSSRQLSTLINEQGGINFNQFVNQFRVEAAQKILLDPKMEHLNLLGVAYEVGFNSKTSFYTKFKKETGQTPNQYKKRQLSHQVCP